MAITTALETESGERIATVVDPKNVLNHILPEPSNARFQWANTIDWYGDTVFNHIQAPHLRREFALLMLEAKDDEDVATLLKRIDDLLLRCETELHLYVKFYGD